MKNLTYKGIDIMKKTKDTITGQLGTAEKTNLIACLATTGATHIAISHALDTNAQLIAAGTTPSPQTIEAEIQEWCDIIHAAGMKVMHRGKFSGTDSPASWGFSQIIFGTGTQLNIGTSGSAPSDGENTFCGRIRRYILTTVGASHWANGDLFSPIYEGTANAFNGKNWWDGADSTNNYSSAFIQFKATSDAAFASISKTVTFFSSNNFSEIDSGWIPGAMFSNQGVVAFDYYGRRQGLTSNQVSDYLTDLNTVYTAKSLPMIYEEWGDISGEALPTVTTIEERLAYLNRFYKAHRDSEVDTNKLIGFFYWGGWEGQNTSLLIKTGSGASSQYTLNARGKTLAAFFKSQGGMVRVPVVTAGSTDDTYTF
jgi:hypothetical protein